MYLIKKNLRIVLTKLLIWITFMIHTIPWPNFFDKLTHNASYNTFFLISIQFSTQNYNFTLLVSTFLNNTLEELLFLNFKLAPYLPLYCAVRLVDPFLTVTYGVNLWEQDAIHSCSHHKKCSFLIFTCF